jgi:hypothetical protein
MEPIVSSITGGDQRLSNVSAHCYASSCSWEPYATLPICSAVENISAHLMYQAETGSRSSPFISLPGITVQRKPVPPSMFVTTVFGTGNGTIGYVGQEADVNATELQLANTESNFDDLAHLYLAYEDPCLMENSHHPGTKYWRAFKGTVKLCLQTLKTTHNSSTHTEVEVADSHTNLTWTPSNNLTWNFNREFRQRG